MRSSQDRPIGQWIIGLLAASPGPWLLLVAVQLHPTVSLAPAAQVLCGGLWVAGMAGLWWTMPICASMVRDGGVLLTNSLPALFVSIQRIDSVTIGASSVTLGTPEAEYVLSCRCRNWLKTACLLDKADGRAAAPATYVPAPSAPDALGVRPAVGRLRRAGWCAYVAMISVFAVLAWGRGGDAMWWLAFAPWGGVMTGISTWHPWKVNRVCLTGTGVLLRVGRDPRWLVLRWSDVYCWTVYDGYLVLCTQWGDWFVDLLGPAAALLLPVLRAQVVFAQPSSRRRAVLFRAPATDASR